MSNDKCQFRIPTLHHHCNVIDFAVYAFFTCLRSMPSYLFFHTDFSGVTHTIPLLKLVRRLWYPFHGELSWYLSVLVAYEVSHEPGSHFSMLHADWMMLRSTSGCNSKRLSVSLCRIYCVFFLWTISLSQFATYWVCSCHSLRSPCRRCLGTKRQTGASYTSAVVLLEVSYMF
jgi:hypothetical protein